MGKPYSDRRWYDAPRAISSQCGECKYYSGHVNCQKHPERIPKEKLDRSFPGTRDYREDYCEYRNR